MISLTNVDGILDADPREKPDAKRIPVVEAGGGRSAPARPAASPARWAWAAY